MSLRRLHAALLTLLLAGTAAHATDPTTTTTKKHPATKSPAKTPGEIKRAPVAKPYKTKTKSRKPKPSTQTTSAKSIPPKSAGTTATVPAPITHTKAVTLRAASATLPSREVLTDHIQQTLATPRMGIENPHALASFFAQLHQLQSEPTASLVRVIQFGDSHTAADVFTGALRTLFQQKFGDGGAGFQYAGYPFAGYRIHGTKRAQSTGWTVLGTHLADIGDGKVGMGGVSLSTSAAGNWVSVDADATSLEVQYLVQSDGGSIEIRDNDTLIATVSTAAYPASQPGSTQTEVAADSPLSAAAVFKTALLPGPHHVEVLTINDAPVRLLGLSTENASGVTYEAAGINGAEASLFLRWNETLQEPLLAAVNPALVVLAYGTNEASDRNWTEESYAAMFTRIIERVRRAAPSASILVVGPPDRALRAGRRAWAPFAGVDRIVAAQRAVCRQMHCAYWDQRSRMGGFGSIREWVAVSWAQPDHTHFTGEGYNELASALFSDILQQYDNSPATFTRAEGVTK
ncbi:MAG: SGNH/GDSL hydrolase family protein [Edaphobacter sp.]